jgi:hypothetical protein
MPKRKRDSENVSLNDTYGPLSQAADSSFRVCTLLPGKRDDPISCRLSQDDWDSSKTSYEAISYVWGDQKSTRTINLNSKPFQVGSNLESVLRHLRQAGRGKEKERRLWVDAICINQADLGERGHQVQQMFQIYHNASKVIVWLGDSDSRSELAFEFANKQLRPCLENVGYSCTDEEANAAKSSFWDQWDEGKDAETLEAVEHLLTRKYAKTWLAMAKILTRPWWSRAWTVQELISAAKVSVHCGSSSMPWALMEMTIQLMLRNTDIENLYPKKLQHILHDAVEDAHAFAYERYNRVLGGHGPETFPQLMQITRCRQSQDARDKVFSILSLLDVGSTKYPFEPNYSEPVHTAYGRAAQAHIQSAKNLHILSSCCSSTDNTTPDLPSWVPDWSRSESVSYLGGYGVRDEEFRYVASGSLPASVEFSSDLRIMTAQGIVVDTIKNNRLQEVTENFDYLFTSAKEEPWTTWNIQQIVKKLENEPSIVRHEGETIRQAVLRTLVIDRHPETGKRKQELKLRRIKQHLWPKAEDLEEYLAYAYIFANRRTFVLSHNGYIGLAPSLTSTGDLICVLYGCHAPVILRPSDGSQHYTLIGDAYVHGLMDGEALQLAEKLPEKRRAFDIS